MNNYLSRNYSPMVAIEGPGAAADRMSQIQQPDQVVQAGIPLIRRDHMRLDHMCMCMCLCRLVVEPVRRPPVSGRTCEASLQAPSLRCMSCQ